MMYLDLVPGDVQGEGEVLMYLSHSPSSAERWTFAEILAGGPDITRLDGEMRNLFGAQTPAELREAISLDMGRARLSLEAQKEMDRQRRRKELEAARSNRPRA